MILPTLPVAPIGETGIPVPTRAPARCRLPAVLAAGFAAVLAMTAAAPAQTLSQAPGADPVIAKVNGMDIHESDLTLAEEDVGHDVPARDDTSKRDYLVNYVADLMLVAQAAEAKKIPDGAEFKQRLAFLRNKALMETVLGQEAKAALTEPALRKIYEDATKSAAGEQEVRARHILFRANPTDQAASKAAEDKVKDTIERIKKGEDFAKLATALTEDPSGKQDGGDLGYFTKDQMVPEFSEAAFTLEKGEISGPIKTQFGWHVLKVEDKRMREPPPFEKVRAELEEYASRRAQTDFVKKLRADAKIERLDKPAQAAK
jgi:peptidyl-prolyl cis-trans isomerase C